jgi:serine/threonine protein kinase
MTVEGRLTSGDLLAGYRVVSLVGRGGMGEVYRARDERLDRDIALKVLSPEYAADPGFRARLVVESRLAASLDHPNVVPVYDAGDADGQVFIAMRFVDGTDLAAEIQRGPVPPERAVDVAGQVAAALDTAHEQGLVHRDVKPSNVLVDRRGHCYLTDFGLSRAVADPDRLADASLVGTVDYVAPEQIRGDEPDARADVYALGCVLVELLTGDVPFPRPTDVATLFAHLEADPPRPSGLRPRLPTAVDDVVGRALAKDPAMRQGSCGQLVDEARRALGFDAPPRRRRWPVFVAAVLVAAVSVVAVLRPWQTTPTATPTGSLIHIDPRTGKVVGRTDVPGHPLTVVSTPGGIWMADFRDAALWRFEPGSKALQRISSTGEPRDIAADGEDVYVASDGPKQFSGNVARHDARTGARKDGLEMLACALGSGDGVVWAAGCPFVQRLSTDGGPLHEVVRVFIPYVNERRAANNRVQVRELAVGGGSLWVLGDALDRRLWRLDQRTGDIQATINLPVPPRSLAVGVGLVWVTDPLNDAVVPIDMSGNVVLPPVAVGHGAAGVTAGAGSVWVASAIDGTVSQIDPDSRRVVRTIMVGGFPHELAVNPDGVWVTTHAN